MFHGEMLNSYRANFFSLLLVLVNSIHPNISETHIALAMIFMSSCKPMQHISPPGLDLAKTHLESLQVMNSILTFNCLQSLSLIS